MKKIFAFVSFVVFAIACAAPPTNRDVADTNRNTNVAVKPAAVVLAEADAIAKEKAIWDAIKNKDYETFTNMLDSNQVEVLGEGVFDKARSIAGVKEFEPSEANFSDWKYLPVNKNVVLLTYTVAVKGKYKGKAFPLESARASSAWVNRDGKWLAVYHQESPVQPAPPAARATPAKAAASPAASPATPAPLTIGSDPIANEKAIWDALKTKNYDGFASALAEDAIEVESTGVFDKAGTVKLVSGFDFAKSEVSDFKSVPIDAETALVTYVVKTPGPGPAERHTTIWANRAGKWLAVFHQGTPIPKGTPAPAASPTASPAVSPAVK